MACEVRILDRNLVPFGMISEFVSLVWEEQYNTIGSVQLVVNKTEDVIELLKVGRFLSIKESRTLAYIHSVEDNGTELWIYAKEAKWLLSARIHTEVIDVQAANVETMILNVLSKSRLQSIIEVAPPKGLTGTADAEFKFPTVAEVCEKTCIAADYGWSCFFDKAKSKLVFEIYQGKEVINIKFAERYGNLADLNRILSYKDFKNVAYVIGEERTPGSSSGSGSGSGGGDSVSPIGTGYFVSVSAGERYSGTSSSSGSASGASRVFVTVGEDESSNLDRWELFIDASDIKQGDMSDTQYGEALKARALEELALRANVDSVEFSVVADVEEYGTEYTLGDWLTCVLPEYNVVMKSRITGVRFVWENNTKKLELTMGTPMRRASK